MLGWNIANGHLKGPTQLGMDGVAYYTLTDLDSVIEYYFYATLLLTLS